MLSFFKGLIVRKINMLGRLCTESEGKTEVRKRRKFGILGLNYRLLRVGPERTKNAKGVKKQTVGLM